VAYRARLRAVLFQILLEEGNIGPVAQALMERLGAFQAIFCPAFPENGRTLYHGHLFVNGKPLNESGMESHPLTPMTDTNIVRWLGKQSTSKVGLVAYDVVRKGAHAIGSALDSYRYDGTRLVVVDAITEVDLAAIGIAAAEHRLVTGGSGVALGLPYNFSAAGKLGKSITKPRGVKGASVVLSGSCSQTSRRQLAAFLEHRPGLLVTAEEVLGGRLSPQDAVDFAIAHRGQTTAIYSSADADTVAVAQRSYGRDKVAEAIESFFGETALLLVQAGYTRFVVGGGETSGAVVKALKIQQFTLGAEIDPGVPALFGKTGSIDIGLALKSGNFGSDRFYEKAVEAL
jgi:uncharacterized protein YgbK (DUF1537 family)